MQDPEKEATGLASALARAVELIRKNHPEIVEKIKAKDVPLKEKVSALEKVIRVHATEEGVKVFIEASE